MNKTVTIIGAGGHAKVIADIICKSGDIVYGFLDDQKDIGTTIIKQSECKVIGKVENCIKLQEEFSDMEFIIAVGNNKIRKQIAEKYKKLNFYTAVHPSSQISLDVKISEGTVVMANACINTNAIIGKHCIVNTGAVIEHDNKIEDYVHISPNGTCCGTVEIGNSTHIGAGAIIKNNIKICKNCVIGAGAVVVKDIDKEGTYVGVPCKKLEK